VKKLDQFGINLFEIPKTIEEVVSRFATIHDSEGDRILILQGTK
jgi:hypothetical protein